MDILFPPYDPEAYRFHSIREFKESMRCGGEAVIEWKGIEIGFWSEKEPIRLTRSDLPGQEWIFENADEVLDYQIGNDRLRDVITKAEVLDRLL